MIGIICPTCRKPRKTLYPDLQWARVHNPDLPPQSFIHMQGIPDVIPPMRDYPRKIYLQNIRHGGARFDGYLEFCEKHEMDTNHIGRWLQRTYDHRSYHDTKLHKVESKVNDQYITKCGRRFPEYTNAKVPNKLIFFTEAWEEPCQACEG